MNSQVKTDMGRGPEGSPAQERLSPWNWGAPPSQQVDTFRNLKAFSTAV